MIIYHREKQTIVIPAAFGDGVSIAPQDCEEAIEEAYQSGWTGGYNQGQEDCPECSGTTDCSSAVTAAFQSGYTEGFNSGSTTTKQDIDSKAITLSVSANGIYSADTGNNIYFKDVEVNVNRNTYRYEVTFYYDEPSGSQNMASHMPKMSINGNDIEPIWYAGLILGTGAYKTTYLYDLLYAEPQISGITSFDIQLKIQNGTAPDALRCIRVNGADFTITSQTREYLRTDEDNFSYWVFHILGSMTDIPPYGYFNFTSAKVSIYGLSGMTNNIEFSRVGGNDVIADTNYLMEEVEDEYQNYWTEISANLKFNKFGSILNMVDNRFMFADNITILVDGNDYENFSDWTDSALYTLHLNGYTTSDGKYVGGYKVGVSNICVSNSGTSKKLQIWFDGNIHC